MDVSSTVSDEAFLFQRKIAANRIHREAKKLFRKARKLKRGGDSALSGYCFAQGMMQLNAAVAVATATRSVFINNTVSIQQ